MAEPIKIDVEIETIDNTDPELSKITENINKMKDAADKANSSTKKAGETVTKFDKSAQKTQKSLASWAKEKYEIMLEAKDKIMPVLSTIKGGLKSFTSKTWSVTMKAVDLVTAPVRGIINMLRNPLFQAGAVLGVSFGVADTINTYKDFEAAMSQVQSVSGATTSELTKLTAKAKEMGAATKFTATESAEAFNYMAMAGWNAQQMTDGIGGILKLAAASGEDLATTSDIVTDALTAFGLKASDATHFSDVLAQASSSANTDVGMMGETFKYVASMAGSLSYSIEDVALMTGLMANSGIKSTQAGTSLNAVLTRLATNSGGAADMIAKLGVNFYDSAGNARPLAKVMGELRDATKGMNQEQKSNLANTVAGMEAQKGLLAILNASEEDYNKLAESIANADGAAERMSQIQLDNLAGDMTLFQSAVDGLKITLGERMSNSWLRDIVQWLTEQVPNVEQMFSDVMDSIEKSIDRAKQKFSDISTTDEWKNADFFGKAKILWDDFIIEPFSEWWESEGKAKMNVIVGDIGNAIGTGLTVGIGTILGIDLSETIDEGNTLGASFAKGFSDGFDFDLVSGKILDGLGNLFSSAGKLLPGGESADLSSLLSASLLMKMGSPLLSLGKGAFDLGKVLFGKGGTSGISLMSSIIGSTGNAMVGGSGILGGLANVGYALNPGSTAGMYFGSTAGTMSGGMAALTGAGAVAGGVAAGASLISAGVDAYKAFKSEDKAEKAAYGESAAWKTGGVAAGAAAGAAIGSIIPGLGTAVGALVGAGIGGISGWIKGNKVKEEYKGNVEEMQAMADKIQSVYESTGVTIDETAQFANEALNEALHDTSLSAEEFAYMFQESCANSMRDAFGDITLSLTEVKKLAEEITFGDMKAGMEEFSSAIAQTESSLTSLRHSSDAMKRENWKVGLGMELSELDRDNYKKTVDSFVQSAQDYIDNSHYEATVALKLLTGESADTTSLDSMYGNFTQQVDDLSKQLGSSMEIALSDGVISLDESAELMNLQQQITDITNKLTEAQNEAELQSIGIKFKASGADLTPESWNELQEYIGEYRASATENLDSALSENLKNLNMQRNEGVITQEQYDSMYANVQSGYNAKIASINENIDAFNFQTIVDAYGSKLDEILPEIEGTTREKLQTAMNNALFLNPEADTWDGDFMNDVFDLGSLVPEDQANIGSALQNIAAGTPETVKEQIIQSYKDSIPTADEIMAAGVDCSGIMQAYMPSSENYEQIMTEWNEAGTAMGVALNTGMSTSISGQSYTLRTELQSALDTATVSPFVVNPSVTVAPKYNYTGLPAFPARTVSAHAAGGYVSGGPQLSWLAEEGWGEFIIPTNPSRRKAALDLYEQAGAALGVREHAAGGYVSGSNSASKATDYNLFSEVIKNAPISNYEATVGDAEDNSTVYEPVSAQLEQNGGNSIQVPVNVSVSPQFVIEGAGGKSEEDVMAIIRKNMKAMADELGGEIADRLEKVFSNMPTVKEA